MRALPQISVSGTFCGARVPPQRPGSTARVAGPPLPTGARPPNAGGPGERGGRSLLGKATLPCSRFPPAPPQYPHSPQTAWGYRGVNRAASARPVCPTPSTTRDGAGLRVGLGLLSGLSASQPMTGFWQGGVNLGKGPGKGSLRPRKGKDLPDPLLKQRP